MASRDLCQDHRGKVGRSADTSQSVRQPGPQRAVCGGGVPAMEINGLLQPASQPAVHPSPFDLFWASTPACQPPRSGWLETPRKEYKATSRYRCPPSATCQPMSISQADLAGLAVGWPRSMRMRTHTDTPHPMSTALPLVVPLQSQALTTPPPPQSGVVVVSVGV